MMLEHQCQVPCRAPSGLTAQSPFDMVCGCVWLGVEAPAAAKPEAQRPWSSTFDRFRAQAGCTEMSSIPNRLAKRVRRLSPPGACGSTGLHKLQFEVSTWPQVFGNVAHESRRSSRKFPNRSACSQCYLSGEKASHQPHFTQRWLVVGNQPFEIRRMLREAVFGVDDTAAYKDNLVANASVTHGLNPSSHEEI